MQNLPVEKIMTTQLITVNCNDILTKVVEIFKSHSFHHIPIVDDNGKLEGIISRTDFDQLKTGGSLFRNPNKENYNKALFRSMRACEIMTKNTIELQPTDTIQKAYQIFKENKFRALPVIGKGLLVGIVTPLDLLDYFFQMKTTKA